MYKKIKNERTRKRLRRKLRIRNKINGTAQCPRISVFRSNKHLMVQVIDDQNSRTLCTVSTLEKDLKLKGNNKETAKKLGEVLGDRMSKEKITQAVFDRNGFLYHGKIAAMAEGLRAKKINF